MTYKLIQGMYALLVYRINLFVQYHQYVEGPKVVRLFDEPPVTMNLGNVDF
jgi:hypothetical protein